MSDSYVVPLPPHPDLDQQRTRARELLDAVKAGDAAALDRARALHPHFDAERFLLADAQLVIARGYGYPDWARLKERIESLHTSPLDQLVDKVHDGQVEGVRALLEAHPELAERLNEPLSWFDGPLIFRAVHNLPLLDLLLAHGADINRRSDWWAGSFGILDSVTPDQAQPLIERGAVVDVWAASHLGRMDRLRELVEADPSLVHARGGDGQTPLHFAATVEIAAYLLDHGADIDARDVDHESTPAQWAVTERPQVARHLVERGAWCDIYLAVALGDLQRVRQTVEAEPECLDFRIGQGLYQVRHNGSRASTPEELGGGRGNIYFWTLGGDLSPHEVAAKLGHRQVYEWLLEHSAPSQRLLAACSAGDRETAAALVAERPELVASLSPEEHGRLADMARDRKPEAVALMLELGFPIDARGQHGATPLHWAAWRGDLALVDKILRWDPPLEVHDRDHDATPLGWAVYASHQGWDLARAGDYGPMVQRLIEAGCTPHAGMLPCPNESVDTVLREALAAS